MGAMKLHDYFLLMVLLLKPNLSRAEDCSTVAPLLEKNADCDATDDKGMTPLDHLSKIQESGKLSDLLVSRQKDQKNKKFLEACSKQKERMDALEKELSNIVGLNNRCKSARLSQKLNPEA
ncbi:hypothetical protein Patl1_27407 [Pistacia atlantica]|uniref:Uncharacterized protein n=1 Tax=Pistacia atlantica TaxID=434234 RepID=A0ACC1BEZ4_9ROSI|nr:hypothetical protein Patl1_27407 [Pistacia atlantica]